MSTGPRGVARTASYRRLYFSLKNTLYVESNTAPFMAAAASRPGAIKAA